MVENGPGFPSLSNQGYSNCKRKKKQDENALMSMIGLRYISYYFNVISYLSDQCSNSRCLETCQMIGVTVRPGEDLLAITNGSYE